MDCEPPKMCRVSRHRARKAHCCCECRGTISPGEVYEVITGVWDSFSTYKTCLECTSLRQDIQAAIPREDPTLGELYEQVFEDRDVRWVVRYMEIRRKRHAPVSPQRWMEEWELKLEVNTTQE